jgi:hypothetical protein
MRLLQLGVAGALTALVAAGACDGAREATTACVAGQTRACTGPGHCAGVQLCNADGTALGACTCGSGGAAGQGGSGAAGGLGGTGGGAGAGGVCVDDVPDGVDALFDTGQFLPNLDADHFCSAGYLQLQIVSIPTEEQDMLAQSNPVVALSVLGLSNSANRDWAMINMMRRDDPDPQSPIVVKAGGGACIECHCCQCFPAMSDWWCGSEVRRSDDPPLVEGGHYTLRWSSLEHTMWWHQDGDPEVAFHAAIIQPFAFNRYCAAPGCAMMNWAAERWTTGSAVLTDFHCDQTDSVSPAGCP